MVPATVFAGSPAIMPSDPITVLNGWRWDKCEWVKQYGKKLESAGVRGGALVARAIIFIC